MELESNIAAPHQQELDKDNFSDSESEEEDHDQKLLLESEAGKSKPFLYQVNWRNIATVVCLWMGYVVCAIGFSLLGPFFPQEVFI